MSWLWGGGWLRGVGAPSWYCGAEQEEPIPPSAAELGGRVPQGLGERGRPTKLEAGAAIEHRRQEPRKQGFCRKRFVLGC